MENLKGLKVAILVDNGFEQVELVEPRKALDQAGAETGLFRPEINASRAGNSLNGATSYQSMSPWTKPCRAISTRCCCPVAL